MRYDPLGQKMFTRRNWLLRCSILINVVVLMYICSHLVIGTGNNFGTNSFMAVQQQALIREQPMNVRETLFKNEQIADEVPVALPEHPPQVKMNAELDPNIGDPAALLNNPSGDNINVNNSNPDGYIVTGDEKDFDDRLRAVLKCYDRPFEPETLQRGDFWVLKNYVRAEHGELKCHESITYTTHADYTFLDNLIPLLER